MRMDSKELNVALIGCGRVAGHHCLSVADTSGVRLTAVCDLVVERAQQYGEKYRVPYYSDYHQMLKSHPETDIVAIMTPSGMHAQPTLPSTLEVMRSEEPAQSSDAQLPRMKRSIGLKSSQSVQVETCAG